MALRLLHFADLHLDRSFSGEHLSGPTARRRREELRSALGAIVQRARDESVDLITCAGDLFEHDQVTRDTGNFVAQTLGESGRPVLIAPGHSDPALPGSPYRYMRWPANVRLASHEELRPYDFNGVRIWAAGFVRKGVTEAPLRDFARLESGVNLLLLHASDMSALPAGTAPLKPLTPDQVREAGFRHALLGHYHQAVSSELITYPGSPEPLTGAEDGRHCTALVTIQADGAIEVRLDDLTQHPHRLQTIDVSGISSREQIREAILGSQNGEAIKATLRQVRLIGRRPAELRIDAASLAEECAERGMPVEIEDQTQISHDLESVAQEFTSRGEMVRKLVERQPESPQDREAVGRALQLALDAFEQ